MYGLYAGVVLLLGVLLSAVVLLARKNGSKAARLEALKMELKKQEQEQARARKISTRVYRLSADDARRRLHEIVNQ